MPTTSTTEKTCGTCTLCCKVVAVDSLSKPKGVQCAHVLPGKGCAIYGDHPADCRGFMCGWLEIPDLGDEWKPDACGFVLRAELDGKRLCIDVDQTRPDAWRDPRFYPTIKEWSRSAWTAEGSVMVYIGLEAWAIFPEEDLHLGPHTPGELLRVGYRRTRTHQRPYARLERHNGQTVDVSGRLHLR